MKILNFGACNIDKVYSLDHIVAPGETISAWGMAIYPGGKGLNQSVALAKAGADVSHAGCIGRDGLFLRDMLLASGVNTDLLQISETEVTGHAVIQVDPSAENSIIVFGGANTAISRAYVREVLSQFAPGSILVLQNEINDIPYIVECAADQGLQIFLNPSPFNDVMRAISLDRIHCLILNETEARAFLGCGTTDEFVSAVRQRYPRLRVVLTMGKGGSAYIDQDTYCVQPAYRVSAVDTTGAGDTFTGYFIAEISRGTPPAEALRIASAAAAISVSRKGASSSIPDMSEVLDMINH